MKSLSYATTPGHTAGGEETDGGRSGWMARLLQMCVFLSWLPSKKTTSLSLLLSLRCPSYLTPSFWPPLHISFPFSPSPSLHVPATTFSPPISSPLSLPPSDLLFTSLPWLFLPFPLTPEIPPSAPDRLDLHQQCFPPRKRNVMMNKRTERWDR